MFFWSTQLSRMEGWVDGIRRGAGPYNWASATMHWWLQKFDIALLPQFLFAYKKYQLGVSPAIHVTCGASLLICAEARPCACFTYTLRCHPGSASDSWTKATTPDSCDLTWPACESHQRSLRPSLSPTCDPYLESVHIMSWDQQHGRTSIKINTMEQQHTIYSMLRY
jgi:hypothetical protein